MKLFYTVIAMVVMLFIITFSLDNATPVNLKYYNFFTVAIDAYMLIFICFGAGVVFAGLFGLIERFRLSRKVTKLTKEIKVLERYRPEEQPLEVLPEESTTAEKPRE